jgi:hypothetical protein
MLDRKQRIAAARLTGLTAAHVQVRRLDRDAALAEIAEVLAEHPRDVRAAILADAAADHASGERPEDPASLDLLVADGADLDEARKIRAARLAHGNPLRDVADQANRVDRGWSGHG